MSLFIIYEVETSDFNIVREIRSVHPGHILDIKSQYTTEHLSSLVADSPVSQTLSHTGWQ